MPNSLLTGVSGLISHQRLLDTVGHNIANMNTMGYKSNRILFADLLYETIRPASSSNDGQTGGINPNQVGGGVKVAATDRNMGQGALENTGEGLDFALSGAGFFVVTDGVNDYYTRAGAFSLDEEGTLVAQGGLKLKRFSSAGEGDALSPGFQIPGESQIRVPIGAPIEGVLTTTVQMTGNLSSLLNPASQRVLETSAFKAGGTPATGATLLKDLDLPGTAEPYQTGDAIIISGTLGDNSSAGSNTLTIDENTTTLQDLIDAINAQFTGATSAIDADGKISVTSDTAGKSSLAVSLTNESRNRFSLTGIFQPTVDGANAGESTTLVDVYDVQGGKHELDVTFIKETDDAWTMKAKFKNAESGEFIDDTIENIVFDDSGALLATGEPAITFRINGIEAPQTILFSFSENSNRLTHFKSSSNLIPVANGSAPGVLSSINVDKDGLIKGVASNGQTFDLAQLAIANFRNPKGLSALANNLFGTSLNSGQAEIGVGGSGGRGEVQSGQLEASNVDIALEFTRLIVAQRGFAANARTITVTDQMLQELTNIIR